MKALDALKRNDIPTAVVTSLLQLNLPDLEELYPALLSHGVHMWQLQLVNPMGNMASRRDLILRRDQMPSIIRFIRRKSCERKMIVVAADSIGYYFEDCEAYMRGRLAPICVWDGCQAGITGLFIDSAGNVKGCGALYNDSFIEGNVREKSVADIWNDERTFLYNRAFRPEMLTGSCKGCELGRVCQGGCRASNFFTSNALYENAYCPHGETGKVA